jgi:hypothetical protein
MKCQLAQRTRREWITSSQVLDMRRTTMLYFPAHVTDAMSTCALRFDGYKLEDNLGIGEKDSVGAGLIKLIEPVVRTLSLHADDNLNFAAFFGLQRYLYKSDGVFYTKYSDEHSAYDFLFLHLYCREAPHGYRIAEYCAKWQREYEGCKEEIASFVRSSFRRKGRGPKTDIGTVIPTTNAERTGRKKAGKVTEYAKYKEQRVSQFWTYQRHFFGEVDGCFERPFAPDGRPPVFHSEEAWRNVIVYPDAGPEERSKLLALIPKSDRHKWFRSMSSSQALAQSLFGNLAINGLLGCLTDLYADEGQPLLGDAQVSTDSFMMEFKVGHLGEPRPTSLDGYFSGSYRVAIECKFTEEAVGACSRPTLNPKDSNYKSDFCNGNYAIQHSRIVRCPLTQAGILYWRYVPHLFTWRSDSDLTPCPLNDNYQLVRNILAVGVNSDGTISREAGHVVLIYDERNPAFQDSGKGLAAYWQTQSALREPTMLRKCSWQTITAHLRRQAILPWLTEHFELKYGL